jgi:endonuclease G
LSSPSFQLSAAVLNTLAARNHFTVNEARPVLIFGLRGCKLANGGKSAPWALTHDLEAIDPTHLETRCVMGVLRKSDGMITLFQASTVPAVAAVYKSSGAANGGGTSVLPTGLYAYRIGDHRAAYPTRIQRAALLIQGEYCVLRTTDDLTYDAFSEGDAWTRGSLHNIHSGGSNTQRYNSNGCQVIEGGYQGESRRSAWGPWGDFRAAAGLVDADGAPLPAESRPSYQYMLLTGREAALAYQGGAAFNNAYWRLRHGSGGDRVMALQQRLFSTYTAIAGARADGDFGKLTSFAVLLDKKESEGEFTSPIVSI